jgi:penicillin-binding protein 1A
MQQYAEESVIEHLSKDIQPKFFKEQKNRKKAPFAWNMSTKQINNIMNSSMRRTERYRVHKKAGLSQDSIKAVFNTPTEMTVFSWEGVIDTLLSPMDSLRYYKHFLHTGFMSVDPHSGHVKAYVGGANYRYFKYDHVTAGKRQVGSTFKPLLYTLAMQNGYSPCYEVPNIPTTFILPNGKPWEPKNAGDERDGEMVSLKWGLSYSVNYISAWLMKQFKPQPVIDIARKMGIKSDIPAVPSICLGVADISVYEMTRAYSTFANKGINVEPIFITRIEDSNGNVLATFTPETKEAISEETAFLMLDMLQSVTRGGAIRTRYKYKLKGEFGGKTGTTQNQSDGWYMGIHPNLVSGCWSGFEDRGVHFRSLYMGQGANMALPIYAMYMQKVLADESLGYSDEDKFEKPLNPISVDMDCDIHKKDPDTNTGIDPEQLEEDI